MQSTLEAIQRCSIKKKAQLTLIQLGTIPWIINILSNYKEVSEYTQEYAAALLMNLSLRTAGKKACLDPTLKVLEVLSSMLGVGSYETKTYINGTIYSLLSLPEFKAEAKVTLKIQK